MEEIDRGPEQVLEIGLKPGVGQRGDKSIEDVGQSCLDGAVLGQRARIGLVLARAVAEERKLGDDRRCR